MPFIVDRCIDTEIIENLGVYDTEIIKSYNCNEIYFPLNTHPDLQLHKVCENIVYVEPNCYEYYKAKLPDYIEVRSGQALNGGTYTSHIAYNIARVGKNILCNTKYADENIMNYYKEKDYNLIHIKQGYSKCNICIVSDNAVITEDKGIAKVLENSKINCCLLDEGSVRLSGFPYGFIGGASGSGCGKLFFCGDIEKHPQYEMIYHFVTENSELEIMSLKKGELCDFGSIIEL